MATRRYGLSQGQTEFQVTESVGAAVNANNIELTVDLAQNMSKNDVLIKLQELCNYITAHNWPPA